MVEMFSIGTYYYLRVEGVPQNYAEAVKWWRLASEQGFADAQYNLGHCYDNGIGVEQGYSEAARWYRLAAEQGAAEAQSNIGVMYENGDGVEKNIDEAGKWYRLAAEQDSEEFIRSLRDLAQKYLSDETF